MEKIDELVAILKGAKHVVAIIGAGMSTASGIPDFNGADGLYNNSYENVRPEVILSTLMLGSRPDLFYRFLREKLLAYAVTPNAGHYALQQLESMGILKAVITQNIDDLERKAGVKNAFQVHGSLGEFECIQCHTKYSPEHVKSTCLPISCAEWKQSAGLVPRCLSCGHLIRPNVTLYGEMLQQDVLNNAITEIEKADVALIIGTSFQVYPVSNLLHSSFTGTHIIVINQGETGADRYCDLKIEDSSEKVLPLIVEKCRV